MSWLVAMLVLWLLPALLLVPFMVHATRTGAMPPSQSVSDEPRLASRHTQPNAATIEAVEAA